MTFIVLSFIVFLFVLLKKERTSKEIFVLSFCFVFTLKFLANGIAFMEPQQTKTELVKKNISEIFKVKPYKNSEVVAFDLPGKGGYQLAYDFQFKGIDNNIIKYYVTELKKYNWSDDNNIENTDTYIMHRLKNQNFPGILFFVCYDKEKNITSYGTRIDTTDLFYELEIKNNLDLQPDSFYNFCVIFK